MTELPAFFAQGTAIAAARPPSLALVKSGHTSIARAICARCGATQHHEANYHMPWAALRRLFESLGWNIDDAGKTACPTCVRNDRLRAIVYAGMTFQPIVTTKVIAMSKPASNENAPSTDEADCRNPSMMELRQIMAALETHFVDGIYVGGKSDQAIAAELDLPRRMVEKVRIEAFGHIKNAELEQLKQDANALKVQVTDMFRRIANLEARTPK